jgi:hypothetical protein
MDGGEQIAVGMLSSHDITWCVAFPHCIFLLEGDFFFSSFSFFLPFFFFFLLLFVWAMAAGKEKGVFLI